MKILLLLFPLIFLSACIKDHHNRSIPLFFPGDTSKGFLIVKKNNQNMIASADLQVCYSDENRQTLNINTYDNRGVRSEYFVLQCLELNFNKQTLCYVRGENCNNLTMSYFSVVDDQLIDTYILNTKKNNIVQITEIDTTTGWISGTIEMHFDRDKSKPKGNAANPEKVSFTDGRFKVILND